MKNVYFGFVMLTFFSIFLGCPSNTIRENCNGYNFDFTLPVQFIPGDSAVQIGDTLTFRSTFPAIMWDDWNQEQLYFDSNRFYMRGFIYREDTIVNGQYPFLEDFEIQVDSIYKFQQNYSAFTFIYRYENENYDFTCRFIPQTKGLYTMRLYSEYEENFQLYTPPPIYGYTSNCYTDDWSVLFIVNERNSNEELIEQIPFLESRNWNKENWGRVVAVKGGYLFKVVE